MSRVSHSITILQLPEDILGLIFSKLWRIKAKGIPLTCRLFSYVLKSPRYFTGWRRFTIRIQDTPNMLRRYTTNSHITSFAPVSEPKYAIVKYDHLDTVADLLDRLKSHVAECSEHFIALWPQSSRYGHYFSR